MNNRRRNSIITGILVCFLFYNIVSIVFLYRFVLFPGVQEPVKMLTYLLLVQNALVAAGLFAASLWFMNRKEKNAFSSPFSSLMVMSEAGKQEDEVKLYNINSLSVAKKDKGNLFFGSVEADSFDWMQYAIFNLVSGCWYIEALTGKYPVGIKKENDSMVYRLKTEMPYKLSHHDIIYIDSYKILVQ